MKAKVRSLGYPEPLPHLFFSPTYCACAIGFSWLDDSEMRLVPATEGQGRGQKRRYETATSAPPSLFKAQVIPNGMDFHMMVDADMILNRFASRVLHPGPGS